MKNKSKYTKEEIESVVKQCFNKSDLLRALGRAPSGGNFKIIDIAIKKFNIDISHFDGRNYLKYRKIRTKKFTLEELLVEDSIYSGNQLKLRLFEEGIKKHICERCLLTNWLNNLIPLELHHKNGVNTDHRLENLEVLCSNCHALTDNFRSKNKIKSSGRLIREEKIKQIKEGSGEIYLKKESRYCKTCASVLREDKRTYCCVNCYNIDKKSKIPKVPAIIEAFKEYKSFLGVARFFNVSDNTVRKWLDGFGIRDMVSPYLKYETKLELKNY